VRHAQRRFAGEGLALYFVLEGIARFVTETWRGDLGRGVGWGGIAWLSTGRLTALGFVALGALLLVSLGRRRPGRSTPAPAPSAG
jgi:prolipoprotein diacylglyceryltransferase